MAYRILDLELRDPVRDVALTPEEDGFAVLVRLDGRPVHVAIEPAAPGSRLDGAALRARAEVQEAIVAQAVRDALAPPVPAPRPSVTIAVCTHGRPDLLEPCLRSVLALGGDLDVLVVDNAPPDGGTAEVVGPLGGVRYAVEPRPGLDFARNRALADARGDFVAYLDDDVVVDPGWLDGLAEALAENPDAGAVCGLVAPFELRTEAQVVFERRGGFRRGCRKLRHAGARLPREPFHPYGAGIFGAGANMVVRRDVALALGGFDEALDTGPPLPGGGDLDIFARVVASGRPLVYEPRMLVRHRHREDMEALRRQFGSWGEGFMAYVVKTYGADPAGRLALRGLVAWWFGYELGILRAALRGHGPLAPGMAAAELAGGVRGLAGSYGRSRRRVARIRRAHG